jgi:hypothetical protein
MKIPAPADGTSGVLFYLAASDAGDGCGGGNYRVGG